MIVDKQHEYYLVVVDSEGFHPNFLNIEPVSICNLETSNKQFSLGINNFNREKVSCLIGKIAINYIM